MQGHEFGFSPLLKQQVLTQRAEIVSGMVGYIPEPLKTFERERDTLLSLSAFASEMNRGELTLFMKAYPRRGKQIHNDNRQFLLSAPVAGIDTEIEIPGRASSLYLDGQYSLYLQYQQEAGYPQEPLAVVSFVAGSGINDYLDFTNHTVRFDTYPPNQPIIVQLQALYREKDLEDNDLASEVKERITTLNEYEWEPALVDIIGKWAQRSGCESMYILPSSLNQWNFTESEDRTRPERMGRRYDQTAVKSGFKVDEHGIFKRDITRPTFSFY